MVSGPHAAKSKVKERETVIRQEETHMGVGRTDTLGTQGRPTRWPQKVGSVCQWSQIQ